MFLLRIFMQRRIIEVLHDLKHGKTSTKYNEFLNIYLRGVWQSDVVIFVRNRNKMKEHPSNGNKLLWVGLE